MADPGLSILLRRAKTPVEGAPQHLPPRAGEHGRQSEREYGTNGTHLIDPLYGSWFGYVENSASNGTASVYQTVEVDAQSPILSFDWRFFTSEESLSGHNDIFEVAAYPGVGDTITSTVATVDATAMTTSNGPLYSPVGGPPGLDQGFTRYTVAWAHKSLDLSALIGQTVTVYFRVSDAGDGHSESTGFAVDNIQFVPEPSAFVLAGSGGVALLALRRARSRR